jgi:hypothetical protein
MNWTKEKPCELCGNTMVLVRLKKRQRFTCSCGHTELKETDFEIAVRCGRYDNYFGIIKPVEHENI